MIFFLTWEMKSLSFYGITKWKIMVSYG